METIKDAKPCPFCGGLPYIHREEAPPGRVTFAAVCGSCAAQGPWVKVGEGGEPSASKRAERQWNERVEGS